jgi:hypothetical protein
MRQVEKRHEKMFKKAKETFFRLKNGAEDRPKFSGAHFLFSGKEKTLFCFFF